MQIWEIVVIGIALAMDAFAVSLTDGMTEPKMPFFKALSIAGTFALFQAAMPLLGYYCGYAFASFVQKIAPYLSFALLLFIGAKMIVDCIIELRKKEEVLPKRTGAVKLLAQGVATSLDALAVGVALLAQDTTDGLPFHVAWCALVIGAVTFSLSLFGVWLGKKAGDRFKSGAGIAGGCVLILIGVKLLVEGLI